MNYSKIQAKYGAPDGEGGNPSSNRPGSGSGSGSGNDTGGGRTNS